MAKKIVVMVGLMVLCGGCVNVEVEETYIETKGASGEKALRHVVIFAFKDSVSAEQIEQVEVNFGRLPEEIEEIKGFEWGKNLNTSQVGKGFTHCFVLTFESEEDLQAYEVHPAHEKFKDETIGHVRDLLVVDYWQNIID
jgi:heme-degrading monooxygenase HmoA